MQLQTITAQQLATAVLEGEGSPKDFILKRLRHDRDASGQRTPVSWQFELCGIENGGYWQGRSTAHTRWDAVIVGSADNPKEAAEDALEFAAQDGWLVDSIKTDDIPTQPSVSEDYPGDDDQDELSYYVALWLKDNTQRESASFIVDSLLEAETAKGFLKHLNRDAEQPGTWPKVDRWRKDGGWLANPRLKRRAWHMVNRYFRGPDNRWEPREVPRTIRNTYFYKYPAKKEHAIRLHNTDILTWDVDQNCYVHIGHWRTATTMDRLNTFLPFNWRVVTYKGTWYWWNSKWPDNIQDRLRRDRANRREVGELPWWIPFSSYDWITNDGTLRYGTGEKDTKNGWARPDGSIRVPQQQWRNPPVGALTPPRRGNRGFHPDQLNLRLEGQYLRRLAWIKRVQGKHSAVRKADKLRKEVAEIDDHKKKRKKSGHESMR